MSVLKNSNNHPTYTLATNSGDLRRDIYNYICKNPGIRYRELVRRAGITNGVLSYHLGILEKTAEIRV
jgi:predicted transcriptional regulator